MSGDLEHEILNEAKGHVLVCGYPSPEYDEWYEGEAGREGVAQLQSRNLRDGEAMNWPEQIKEWKIRQGMIPDPDAAMPSICECGSTESVVVQYGITGTLGEVRCAVCNRFLREWNAY